MIQPFEHSCPIYDFHLMPRPAFAVVVKFHHVKITDKLFVEAKDQWPNSVVKILKSKKFVLLGISLPYFPVYKSCF